MKSSENEKEKEKLKEGEMEHDRIERLPQEVINRIAAGEVIIRPSAALKELLENSIDAKSTTIQINVREGGLKQLQINDDGIGIHLKDLEIICERFTTSKLRKYEDLQNGKINTFGFRGEALASICNISRLSIISKYKYYEEEDQKNIAYQVNYNSNGKVLNKPNACAKNTHGTNIIINDLFYNLPNRKLALKSVNEEYRLIIDVVMKYSIFYSSISFSCHKMSSKSNNHSMDFKSNKNSNRLNNIKNAYGSILSNHLIQFDFIIPKLSNDDEDEDNKYHVNCSISSSNFSMKKAVFIFFINGRLVDCNVLKKSIASVYSTFLAKNNYPFVYMELNIPPQHVDVNVHPMKKEVRFLNEDIIMETVVEQFSNKLKGTETSRTFLTQSIIVSKDKAQNNDNHKNTLGLDILPPPNETTKKENDKSKDTSKNIADAGQNMNKHVTEDELLQVTTPQPKFPDNNDEDEDEDDKDYNQCDSDEDTERRLKKLKQNNTKKQQYAKDKVRTGSNNPIGLMDRYITRTPNAKENERSSQLNISGKSVVTKRRRRKERNMNAAPLLTSVENLIESMKSNSHKGMMEILRTHIFIGIVSSDYVLIQHNTELLLVNVLPLISQLGYENILYRFADIDNHNIIEIQPSISIDKIMNYHIKNLKRQQHNTNSNTNASQIEIIDLESCVNVLTERSTMLDEYFGLKFSNSNNSSSSSCNSLHVKGIPGIFNNITNNNEIVSGNMKKLGELLYDIAILTDWSEERACFHSIAKILSNWYAKYWQPVSLLANEDEIVVSEKIGAKEEEQNKREWILRHMLFEAMKSEFYPPKRLNSQNVIREITSTSKLYKIFERC